jgi:hypothetical protein
MCISTWQKARADRFFPALCSECGAKAYIPIKYGFYALSLCALASWAFILPALILNQWWLLIGTPFALIWAFRLHLRKSPLMLKT